MNNEITERHKDDFTSSTKQEIVTEPDARIHAISQKIITIINNDYSVASNYFDYIQRAIYTNNLDSLHLLFGTGGELEINREMAESVLVEILLSNPNFLRLTHLDNSLITKYLEAGGDEEAVDITLECAASDIEQSIRAAAEQADAENEEMPQEKIFLSEEELGWSLQDLQEKYGIVRSTAWRARRRGYFFKNFHNSKDEPDVEYNNENVGRLERIVGTAFNHMVNVYGIETVRIVQRYLEPDDFRQEAMTYLLCRTGRQRFKRSSEVAEMPARNYDGYMYQVAYNYMNRLLLKFLGRVKYDQFSLDRGDDDNPDSQESVLNELTSD
jgi:hypothetical protein